MHVLDTGNIHAMRMRMAWPSGNDPSRAGRFRHFDQGSEKGLWRLDPDLSPAHTNLAYSYFLEGRMKEALEVGRSVNIGTRF